MLITYFYYKISFGLWFFIEPPAPQMAPRSARAGSHWRAGFLSRWAMDIMDGGYGVAYPGRTQDPWTP